MTMIPKYNEIVKTLMNETANRLASETGFIRRERQISGAQFVQALVSGHLEHGEGTRRQMQMSAAAVGVQISVQGLDARYTEAAAEFMRKMVDAALRQVETVELPYLPSLSRFKGVYVTDSTRVVWPGEAVKVGVRLELQSGGVVGCLTDIDQHDGQLPIVDEALPTGALYLADLGFFKLERFKRLTEQGVWWLTRYKVGTQLSTLDGQRLEVVALMHDRTPLCMPVWVGSRKQGVPAYLLAAVVPDDQLPGRMARLTEQARLDQRPLSDRQLQHAHLTIYLTNLPDLSFDHAFILARARWQIECLFKLWKSHGALLRSRSANPIRQRVEGYAKLLALLLAHWSLLVNGWDADRLGALDALRLLRSHLILLRQAFACPVCFADFHHALRHALEAAPRRTNRRAHPNAFQLWASFDLDCA